MGSTPNRSAFRTSNCRKRFEWWTTDSGPYPRLSAGNFVAVKQKVVHRISFHLHGSSFVPPLRRSMLYLTFSHASRRGHNNSAPLYPSVCKPGARPGPPILALRCCEDLLTS